MHVISSARVSVNLYLFYRTSLRRYFDGQSLKRMLGIFMILVAPTIPAKSYLSKTRCDVDEGADSGGGTRITELGSEDHSMRIDASVKCDDASGVVSLLERSLPALGDFDAGLATRLGAIGVGSGLLAGLFGVGGGSVTVPAVTLATDFSHHQALGTSLAAMALPAIMGSVAHYRQGNVVPRVVVPLAVGSAFGAYLGGKLAVTLPEDLMRWGFFVMMVALGTREIIKAGPIRFTCRSDQRI